MADQPTDQTPELEDTPEVVEQEVVDTDDVDESDEESSDDLSDADRHKRDIAKRNKENKSLRDRLRAAERERDDAKQKAAKFDELTDKEKSELTRLTERAERAEKALADKQLEDDRRTVGTEWGLTAKQLKWIKGATLDELRDSAEEYAEDNGIEKPDPKAKQKKIVDPKDVKGRDQVNDKSTPAELAALIPRR